MLALFLAGGLAGTADAQPADRPSAAEAYLRLLESTVVPTGWTGDSASCNLGAEAPASIEATRTAVNILRDFAGLQPVAFDSDLNRKALAAALIMRARNDLSHDPPPDWPCWSAEGDEGAGRSNLALGRSGAGAMIAYVDDASEPTLGHRRWLLDPRAAVFGTGSTPNSNVLLVSGGGFSPSPVPEAVSWPPPGNVPWPLVFADWSAAITAGSVVDVSGASVAVTVDGQPRTASGLRVLPDNYGTGKTVAWNVALAQGDRDAPRDVAVRLSGVLVDGVSRTFQWSTVAFPLSPPAPPSFTASRTSDTVTVSWQGAVERGAPVTGYRITGDFRAAGSEFDRTVGPEVRQLTVPYSQPLRIIDVRVTPLSRAGSPDVAPVRVGLPSPAGGGTESGTDDGPGSGTGGSENGSGPLVRERSTPALRVPAPSIRNGRLVQSVRISRRADGRMVRLTLRGGGRTVVHRRRVLRGAVRFDVRLSARHRTARPLRVTTSFAGTSLLRPASKVWTFR